MKRIFVTLGVLVCVMVWFLPLHHWGIGMFSAHMIAHMGVVVIAAPFIAAGLRGFFSAFHVPVLFATVMEFLVVWAWHIPVLHNEARASASFLIVEQASFLLVGTLVWASVLSTTARLAGAGGLLLTSMHMTLLGAIITLAPRVLYDHGYAGDLQLRDQQLGGMIMLAVGTPIYLVAGLYLVHRELKDDPQATQRPT